jgi:3-ketoacyl-CoA synthase
MRCHVILSESVHFYVCRCHALYLSLQLYQGKRALFVAAEITTVACYTGKDIPHYLANTLFRAGGAAALLTSKPSSATTANYRLLATTRSHDAMNEQAYR